MTPSQVQTVYLVYSNSKERILSYVIRAEKRKERKTILVLLFYLKYVKYLVHVFVCIKTNMFLEEQGSPILEASMAQW